MPAMPVSLPGAHMAHATPLLRPIALVLLAGVFAGCRQTGTGTAVPPPPTDAPFVLTTPYAQQPAAGICAEPTGNEVVMRLEPGIPDPRCSIVRADQRLRVINRTGGDVTISLGPFSLPLPADGKTVIGPTFGQYLLPGVHALQVDPCCGGELWLKE